MEANEYIKNIWGQYARGERSRFKEIYLHYYPSLFAYGKTISHNAELIDSAIQELFIRLWEKPPQDVQSPDRYIFTSFRNQLYRQLKTIKVSTFESIESVTPDGIQDQNSVEDEMIKNETRSQISAAIRAALESLPVRRQEAVFLKFFQGKSTSEISMIMGISEEMVRNYIHKGIKALRRDYSLELSLLYAVQTFAVLFLLGRCLELVL